MTTDSAHSVVPIAARGEAIDLDRVYREQAATVSRWVHRLSGRMDASDTVQEVFEIAQRRLASFRGDAQLSTWLYAITVRVVSARRRKSKLRELLFLQAKREFELELEARSPDTPAHELHRQHTSRVVYSVLDRLSERDRTLLILFELERLPGAEISAILGISENNVAVALHRARERFRRLLRQHFPDEAQGIDDDQSNR